MSRSTATLSLQLVPPFERIWNGLVRRIDDCEILFSGYLAGIDDAAACCTSILQRYRSGSEPRSGQLHGEYAFFLYDKRSNTFVIAHDWLGIVQVYYTIAGETLHVSTDLAALVGITGIGRLDEEYIADYIGEGWHLGERTPYAHIRRLMPMHYLALTNGQFAVEQTDLPLETESEQRGPEAYERQLRELTEDAVASTIPHSGPYCCELSGGLDSSTIYSLAYRKAPSQLFAFSYVYSQSTRCDERRWIQPVLDRYPGPWLSLDVDTVAPFSRLPKYRYAEPTMALITNAREEAYHRLLRRNAVPVVLSGEGGDAVFHGDHPVPYYLADRLLSGRIRSCLSGAASYANESIERRSLAFWIERAATKPAWRYVRGEWADYKYVAIPWLDERYTRDVRMQTRGRRFLGYRPRSVARAELWASITRCAYAVANRYREPNLATEFRHPLFYRPLVEFVLSIPPALQRNPRGDRVLQRKAFESVLPLPTSSRTTKGTADESIYFGLRRGAAWRSRLTENSRIVARGYADKRAWEEAVRRAASGQTVGIRQFIASATLEIWLQSLEEGLPDEWGRGR